VTVTDVSAEQGDDVQDASLAPDTTVRVTDTCPWDVSASFGDVEGTDGETVDLGTYEVGELRNGKTLTYFAEAPEETGSYEFGPATVELQGQTDELSDIEADFGGTDTNVVVGSSTETDL
jgi:hypothetical protein